MAKKNLRELSKNDFYSTNEQKPDPEAVKLGCFQRIADASEVMSQNYIQLQSELDRYKKAYYRSVARENKLNRSNSALRGVITRIMNKNSKLQAFKDYVHDRLDEAGIEKEPNGEHSKAGCRIGDRLDIVLKSNSK